MKYLLLSLSIIFLFLACENNPDITDAYSTSDTTHKDPAMLAKLFSPKKLVGVKLGLANQSVTIGTGSGYLALDGSGNTYSQIIIKGGTYSGIDLSNINGVDSAHPAVIINGGAQVKSTAGSDAGLQLWGCKFFHVTGTGVSGVQYGFLLTGGGTGSFDAHGGSSYGEIDHIECGGSSYAGLIFRTYPNDGCAYTVSEGWSQNNTLIHDNFIHDVPGEGMYIGPSHYGNQVATSYDPVNNPIVTQLGIACAKANEGALHGLHIWNNIVKNVGRDGIQIGGAVDYGSRVDHNTITGFALNNENGDNGGITENPGSRLIVEDNTIDGTGSTNSEGMMYQGQSGSITRNNIFKNLTYGIFFGRNTSLNIIGEPISDVYWDYNTFVNVATPLWLFSNNFGSSKIVVTNNAFTGYTSLTSNGNGANYSDITNYAGTVASANFTSATDFHATGLPLVGKGTSLSRSTLDFDGKTRANPPSIGAYEGGSGGVITPPADTVKIAVSPDQSIILGTGVTTTTVTLTSSATSTTGSAITSYLWQGNSGTITTPASNNTTVSGLTAGNYSFSITAKDAAGTSATAITKVNIAAASTGGGTQAVTVAPGSVTTVPITTGNMAIKITVTACATCPVVPPARTALKAYTVGNAIWCKYTTGTDSTFLGNASTIIK